MKSNIRIFFLRVKDNASKLHQICTTIHHHFVKRERVLVAVPSHEAAIYIDQLLWKLPEESFLPHSIGNFPTQEPIAITTEKTNINGAEVVFNLTPGLCSQVELFKTVYELYDLTSKEKEALSKKKHDEYLSLGYQTEIL